MCGGASSPRLICVCLSGLSPRVRGSPPAGPTSGVRLGSIPACAGEPCDYDCFHFVPSVYPRVCGGAITIYIRYQCIRGLSPRVRGSHSVHGKGTYPSRSIPACAGEPLRLPVAPRGTPLGLSPRVRGSHNRVWRFQSAGYDGSIPACAGEPQDPRLRSTLIWVYPRVCGGAPVRSAGPKVYPRVCGGARVRTNRPQVACGLSPRVRGSL